MLARLTAWFTPGRREAIYAAVAAIAPMLVYTGQISEGQVEPILTLASVVLQAFAGALMLANLRAKEVGDWFVTKARATLYGLATAAAPAAVALGWLTDDQATSWLTGVSLGLTALSAIVAIVHVTPTKQE